MNLSTAVFLINKDVRAILATYERDEQGQSPKPRAMFKTFDQDLKVDDYVIVPTNTRHEMTVCKVVAVDVDVDFDSPVQIAWVIDKVDRAVFERTLAQEQAAHKAIQSAEKRKRQDELRAALLKDNPGLAEALTGTGIADPAVLPAPPAPMPPEVDEAPL